MKFEPISKLTACILFLVQLVHSASIISTFEKTTSEENLIDSLGFMDDELLVLKKNELKSLNRFLNATLQVIPPIKSSATNNLSSDLEFTSLGEVSTPNMFLAGCMDSTIVLYSKNLTSNQIEFRHRAKIGNVLSPVFSISPVFQTNFYMALTESGVHQFQIVGEQIMNITYLTQLTNETNSTTFKKLVVSRYGSMYYLLFEASGKAVYVIDFITTTLRFTFDRFRGVNFFMVGQVYMSGTAIDLSVKQSFFGILALSGKVIIYNHQTNSVNQIADSGLQTPLEIIHMKLTLYYVVVGSEKLAMNQLFTQNFVPVPQDPRFFKLSSARAVFEDSISLVSSDSKLIYLLVDDACPQGCSTCSRLNGKRICNGCLEGYSLSADQLYCENSKCPSYSNTYEYLDQCVPSCPSGFAPSFQQCKVCSSNCRTCYYPGYSSSCTLCEGSKVLTTSGTCEESCPKGQFEGAITKACRNCHDNCYECTGREACTRCDESVILNKTSGMCEPVCPQLTYFDNFTKSCVSCHQNCEECFGSKITQCLWCNPGFGLYLSQCLKDCPNSYYLSFAERKCLKCTPNCASCFQTGVCYECEAGYFLDAENGLCMKSCPISSGGFVESSEFSEYIESSEFTGSSGSSGRFVVSQSYKCLRCSMYCKKCSEFACEECEEETELFQGKCWIKGEAFSIKALIGCYSAIVLMFFGSIFYVWRRARVENRSALLDIEMKKHEVKKEDGVKSEEGERKDGEGDERKQNNPDISRSSFNDDSLAKL